MSESRRHVYFDFDDNDWLQISVVTIIDPGKSNQDVKQKVLRLSREEQTRLIDVLSQRKDGQS